MKYIDIQCKIDNKKTSITEDDCGGATVSADIATLAMPVISTTKPRKKEKRKQVIFRRT